MIDEGDPPNKNESDQSPEDIYANEPSKLQSEKRAETIRKAMEKALTYVTTQIAAKRLKISKRTLDGMRAAGKGPPWYRIGKKVFYALEDLDVWLEDQKVEC